jgi:hypothetical protein
MSASKKTNRVKLLTRPKKTKACSCAPKSETSAQCCAKASRLVAGCHD